uniref:Uncharacterized protein n=1 Tax=Arundo donax TaxID=35708 RepID=A0A0A9H2S9_ARUDO
MSISNSHNAHINSINFIICPYLQQDATQAAYQELGHCNFRSTKSYNAMP